MKSPLVPDLPPADHYSMLELPADRPRPPVSSFRGATRAVRLPAAATASLRQAGGREGGPPALAPPAGLAALLARYSGAEDLVIGAAGPTSLLPLRIQWTGDPPFERLGAPAPGRLSGGWWRPRTAPCVRRARMPVCRSRPRARCPSPGGRRCRRPRDWSAS